MGTSLTTNMVCAGINGGGVGTCYVRPNSGSFIIASNEVIILSRETPAGL